MELAELIHRSPKPEPVDDIFTKRANCELLPMHDYFAANGLLHQGAIVDQPTGMLGLRYEKDEHHAVDLYCGPVSEEMDGEETNHFGTYTADIWGWGDHVRLQGVKHTEIIDELRKRIEAQGRSSQ